MQKIKPQITNSKKGFLFTIGIILIFIALILLTESFSERNLGIKENTILLIEAEKANYLFDDISDNAYNEMLGTNIKSIARTSTVDIEFNSTILSEEKNHISAINSYKSFIEGKFAQLNNANITLTGFSSGFSISPYNTTFFINGSLLRIYTYPEGNNVEQISLTIRTNSSSIGICDSPSNDAGSFPVVTSISVSYINKTGGVCSKAANLNPKENNDISGKQFYQALEPTGSINTKFGLIDSQNGVLEVKIINGTAIFESLKISFAQSEDKLIIYGGNISISASNIKKNSRIIIFRE